LVTVTIWPVVCVPTCCVPKSRLVGLTVNGGTRPAGHIGRSVRPGLSPAPAPR
jgi:hypothetical protein